MLKAPNAAVNAAALRRRAEARLRKRATDTAWPRTDADAKRLLHELQVHQVELETQNAELSRARAEAEASAEKFSDLYDFAPLGYVMLSDCSTIRELNFTAARLLGDDRAKLVGTPFARCVVRRDQDAFVRHLQTASETEGKVTGEFELFIGDGRIVPVELCTVYRRDGPRQTAHYRMAITDITDRKRAEEQIRVLNRDLEKRVAARTAEVRALLEQLRHLSHQVLRAQEEERKRVSRELHDEIAQILIGINLDLLALTRDPPARPQDLRKRIARMQRLVEDSVNTLHRFTRALRPPVLDDLGLIPALHSYIKEFKQRTGIRVRFTAFAGVNRLNSPNRTVLYRVAQAALTNIAQHAKASRVEIRMHKFAGAVCLEIKDDGIGFSLSSGSPGKPHQRLGLLGMKERVGMVGGTFSLESAPGRGTTIRAEIPLGNSNGGGAG